MSRKRPLSSRSVAKLSERERNAGLDPDDDASRWLEEHDPKPPPAAPKRAEEEQDAPSLEAAGDRAHRLVRSQLQARRLHEDQLPHPHGSRRGGRPRQRAGRRWRSLSHGQVQALRSRSARRQTIPRGRSRRASGQFTATLTGKTLKWKLTWKNLSGPANQAHIHLGKRGISGNVLVPLCPPGCTSPNHGTATLTAVVIKAMKAGGTYVNVHTNKNLNGEIRGQITRRQVARGEQGGSVMEFDQDHVWITTRKLKPGARAEFSRCWRPSEFPAGMLRAYECYSGGRDRGGRRLHLGLAGVA